MKIAFIISHIPNPRMNKRIEVAKELGTVDLIYWDKTTVDIWDLKHRDINNHGIIIPAEYTNPLKRLIPTLKFSLKAYKELRKINPSILYVANIDMLIIANIYNFLSFDKSKVVYEIADVNKLLADTQKKFVKKIARYLLTKVEKVLVKNIDTLVVTSERFYENYYKNFITSDKVLFIPNVPKLDVFDNYKKNSKKKFTIGFIGAIRYKAQMKMLIEAAEHCNIEVLFAGAGLDNEIEHIAKEKDFIEYLGKYNYDKDIANLYSKVDAIYSVYDADLQNVRIALPNKFYESIYCEIPIIVAKNTYLAEHVNLMGVGVGVSHKKVEELIDVLTKLKNDEKYYNDFINACKKNKDYININKYNELLKDNLILLNSKEKKRKEKKS